MRCRTTQPFRYRRFVPAQPNLQAQGEFAMIRFEAAQPRLDGPRATVYAFAKKYRLSDAEAERLFVKLGASPTQAEMLAEAKLPAPDFKTPADKGKKS
jgi:hypothetical protein